MSEPGTSTSLVMRGSCRAPVAASQASEPYSDKRPESVSDTTISKLWLATELQAVQSGTT